MRPFALDLRHAVRGLLRTPAFTAVAVLSIAVAVGANTIVLSWLENIVLRPYPTVPDAERLIALNVAAPSGDADWPLSYPMFRDWRGGSRSVAGIAAWSALRVSLREPEERQAASAMAMLVSANYFDVLRVRPAPGRAFDVAEESQAAPVAVISHRYWRLRFGADPAVVGRPVLVNGQPVSIVGVAPPDFTGTYVGVVMDLWMPLTLHPRLTGQHTLDDRGARWLQAVGRLAPGATISQARLELDALARRSSAEHGDRPVTGALVRLPREQFLGELMMPLLAAMLGITALVLLVASANVAGLLLVRSGMRRHELALRVALGAGRADVARGVAAESLVIAVGGGLLGVALAYWGRGAIHALVPVTPLPFALRLALDGRVALAAALLTAVTAILAGVAPALRAARIAPATGLREGQRGSTRGGGRLRSALVLAQVALSLVCLACAGLFVRSLRAASHMDLGFAAPERVLLVGTDFAATRLGDSAAAAALEAALARVRALPGVRAASASTMVPLGFGGHRYADARAEGHPSAGSGQALAAPDENVSVERVLVTDGYFATMGTPLVAGRPLVGGDRVGGEPVAVVNETFARRFWPGRDPLGRRVDVGRGWARVVGVARDGKYRDLTEGSSPVVYLPLAQWFQPAMTLHARIGGNDGPDPLSLAEPVRLALAATHVDLPALRPRTLAQHIEAATFPQRVGASVLAAFGTVALLLAAMGLYALLAYVVTLRAREIGVRLALGAPRTAVAWLVVRDGGTLVVAGAGVGSALALGAGRLLGGQLTGVRPFDPVVLGAAVAVLAAVAAVACWLPARRALRVDPLVTLRSE